MKNSTLVVIVIWVVSMAGCVSNPTAPTEAVQADAPVTNSKEVLASGAESVDTAAPSPERVAELASAESPDDVICRREKVTGSHFARKVCRTRAQIEAEREAHQQALQRVNSTGFGANGGGTN